VRIDRVKALLLESRLSLATIADETGFSDQSHMSKVFRKLTGSTPRLFRAGNNGLATSSRGEYRGSQVG
jgi:AraC family transcriptional regulator